VIYKKKEANSAKAGVPPLPLVVWWQLLLFLKTNPDVAYSFSDSVEQHIFIYSCLVIICENNGYLVGHFILVIVF